VHGAFVADHEVHKVVGTKSLAAQMPRRRARAGGQRGGSGADGEASGEKDALYDQAVEIVVAARPHFAAATCESATTAQRG
jgi:S-DNA-T family DNA segregation ATPase FtsK/SpoIIIE